MKKDTVVFTFGRFNPPTVGHEKLVFKLRQTASLTGGDAMIFLSQTQDKKKNPLGYNEKIKFATRAFGNIVKKSSSKTIIDIMKELQKKKYDHIVLVVGSDRVSAMRDLLNKYNGKDYFFESISVTSAGSRDPDADGVEGMSASKMRQLAKDENSAEFAAGLPDLLRSQAKKVMNAVRSGLELR